MKTLYEVQVLLWSTSVDLLKGIVVLPPSLSFFSFLFFLFLWPLWLFLFISHLSSLGSFNLSYFGIFYFLLFGIFSSLKATLYILQEYRRSHTLQEVLNIKKTKNWIMMYANVCLCQCSRICNDTSASCSNYEGEAQLACSSSIKQKHVWQWKIKSWEDGCCMAIYLGKAMEMPW